MEDTNDTIQSICKVVVAAMQMKTQTQRLCMNDLRVLLLQQGATKHDLAEALDRIANMQNYEVVNLRDDPWMTCVQHRRKS